MLLVGLSFAVSLLTTWLTIIYFRRLKLEQLVMREEGPAHQAKAGTPTMGGVGFLIPALLIFIIYAAVSGHLLEGAVMAFPTMIYMLVGVWDDSVKVFNSRDQGFSPIQKLIVQIVAAIIFTFALRFVMPAYEIGIGAWHLPVNFIVFALFVIFWLVGWTNATNLTDGLDGLLTGAVIISLGVYSWRAFATTHTLLFTLDIIMLAALFAFMVFNYKPAKIFMGDAGSLALGALLVTNSIMMNEALGLVIIGGLYAIETLSVMIQVTSFHFFGRRIFLMTPIHHSLEMGGIFKKRFANGINETTVVWLMWGVSAIFAAIYLIFFGK
jgi:phospho-N-acetylmuramoyl-pentapeptide-transferase